MFRKIDELHDFDKPHNAQDTFQLLEEMNINWQLDKRGKLPGRQKSELAFYKTQSSNRIEEWTAKIDRINEQNLWEIVCEEERLEQKR